MKNLKNEVTEWLRNDRTWDHGLKLYMAYGHNISFKTTMNRAGYTPANLKNLMYELCKMVGISEAQYQNIIKYPVIIEPPTLLPSININEISIEDLCKIIDTIEDITQIPYAKAKALVLKKSIEKKSLKKADIYEAISKYKIKQVTEKIPEKVRKAIKLRDEFPFLKTKQCPVVFHEMVSDMFTAYDEYIHNHAELKLTDDPALISSISQSVVENYLDNRMAWDELNHFKKTGKVLGKHPLFTWINRRNEIDKYPIDKLVQLKDQLENNIPRNEKSVRDEPNHKNTAKRHERIKEMKNELNYVYQKLDIKKNV